MLVICAQVINLLNAEWRQAVNERQKAVTLQPRYGSMAPVFSVLDKNISTAFRQTDSQV